VKNLKPSDSLATNMSRPAFNVTIISISDVYAGVKKKSIFPGTQSWGSFNTLYKSGCIALKLVHCTANPPRGTIHMISTRPCW